MIERPLGQYLILFVGVGLTVLALLFIPIFNNPNSTHATDVSNDLSYNLVNLPYQQPCSYLISENSTFYVSATNCNTGVVSFSGQNASQVINQAINSTTASQLIFIKKGLYKITSPIELQHGLTLLGESAGQNVTNGRQGTHLWVASGRNINAVEYTKDYLGYFMTIQNIFIDGNYQNNLVAGNGVYLNVNASDFEINNTYIDGFRNNCFQSDSSFNYRLIGSVFEHCQNDGVFVKAGTNFFITNSKMLSNINRGIECGTNNGGVVGLVVLGTYIAGNTNNNFITFNCPDEMIQGNVFQEVANLPTNFHLVMENNCGNSIVIGNVFIQQGTSMGGAIDITHSSCNNSALLSNQIAGTYTGATILNSGTGTIIRFNVGFKTENSGTATVASASTSVAVTHGLAYTPSINDISITPQGSWGSCTQWWISNPTSTQFTINCNVAPTAANLLFSWKIART